MKNKQLFRIFTFVPIVIMAFSAIGEERSAIARSANDASSSQQGLPSDRIDLSPITRDRVLPILRQGTADLVVVTGVIDMSGMSGNETWKAKKFEFKPGASIKIGSRSLVLDVDELVAPSNAVIIYTFDEGEVGPKPPRAPDGRRGITPSGDGRDGADGHNGRDGTRGIDGQDGGLLIFNINQRLAQPVFVSLHGQNGGPGGDAGNGGNADEGNRGRRASDGAGYCRSGGGDGGDGGRGGRGGMSGQGGRAGDGGILDANVLAVDDMLEIAKQIVLLGDPATHGIDGARGAGGSGAAGGGGGRGSRFCSGGSGGSRGGNGRRGVFPTPHHPATGTPPSRI